MTDFDDLHATLPILEKRNQEGGIYSCLETVFAFGMRAKRRAEFGDMYVCAVWRWRRPQYKEQASDLMGSQRSQVIKCITILTTCPSIVIVWVII